MKGLFFEAGFNDIIVRSFTGGVAAMHLGYKENSSSKGLTAKLNINNEIKKVEKRLEEAIISSDQTLQEASFHLLSSGEKELDPLLLF